MRTTSKVLLVTSLVMMAVSTSATAQPLPITSVADPAVTYLVIGTSPIFGTNNCFGNSPASPFCVRPAGIDVNYFATAAGLAATNTRIDQAFQSFQQSAVRVQQA